MDFVHDQMLDDRAFRVLTVIDQWSRESVSLEANFRLTGRCVGKALDQAAIERGWPKAITVDNGTEFTSKALHEWAWSTSSKFCALWPACEQNSPERPVQIGDRDLLFEPTQSRKKQKAQPCGAGLFGAVRA
ncbi:DDE-type integrase/transposase/recombinase [Variovorax sp. YR216]|uniref:DDE-type integrase/transposase/recombinase n=1 Tax=Variovorax sp. YR216 TaxID=1882828 RepID=UPI0015A2E5F2